MRLQDPNARNCHGYRKFVRRSTLENPANGYLLNDTIVIRYTIELVVSSGGALTRAGQPLPRAPSVQVPTDFFWYPLFTCGQLLLRIYSGRLSPLVSPQCQGHCLCITATCCRNYTTC